MSREQLMEKMEEIFRDVFEDDAIELTEKMNSADIEGWDSLAQISILAAVQDEFHVKFNIDEIVALKNVGDLVNAIERKL